MAASVSTIVVIVMAFLALAPVAAQARVAGPQGHETALASGNGVYNYSTSDASDVQNVAVSPDGSWVAAATSHKQVDLFSASSGSGTSIAPQVIIPLSSDAHTLALSDSPSGGSGPLLVVGVSGSLLAYNVPSSTPAWNFSTFISAGTATVTSVAVSQDGSAVAVVADVAPPPGTGSDHYTFVYLANGAFQYQWNSSNNAVATDVSMSVNGYRIVVGETLSGVAGVEVFQKTGGAPALWSPSSPFSSSSYDMVDAQISGNGIALFEVSSTGFDASAGAGQPSAVSSLSSANLLSVSFSGCQALVASGTSVYYYNVSQSGQGGCGSTSFTTANWTRALWSASFGSSVTSLSLAANNPSYFVVAWSNEIQWFYAFPGVPSTASSSYRTITTDGTVDSVAIGASGGVTAVGSKYIVGAMSELTLATDSGAPTPSALQVTTTQVPSLSTDTSASETVSWTMPPSYGFDSVSITATPITSGAATPNTVKITNPSTTSTRVTGLSFSATYSVEVLLVVYGGDRVVPSSVATFVTVGAPPVTDPFFPLEALSVAVLVAGIVAYVLLRSRAPKHKAPGPGDHPGALSLVQPWSSGAPPQQPGPAAPPAEDPAPPPDSLPPRQGGGP